MIRNGYADAMITGGGEAAVTRMGIAGFNAMGALSNAQRRAGAASRPFDLDRDGFVLAEGAAVLVLEERRTRDRRAGATILAEVMGYGTTDDANHMVQPAPGGEGAARAMTIALADAGLDAARTSTTSTRTAPPPSSTRSWRPRQCSECSATGRQRADQLDQVDDRTSPRRGGITGSPDHDFGDAREPAAPDDQPGNA